jgi:uncharacterized protein YacL
MNIIRVLFTLSCAAIGFLGIPGGPTGLVVGLLFGVVVVLLEVKLHSLHPNVLMGGVVGTFMGLVLALALGVVGRQLDLSSTAEAVIQGVAVLTLAYLGMVIGSLKGQSGEWWIPWKPFLEDQHAGITDKLLDTSVIIDGRIAEIAATGFVEGTLLVPQFVLNELQQVADSNDALKRARGRRGLDILRDLQRSADLDVQIDATDFPGIAEVDSKLIELGIQRGGVVLTNDFNLAKVAQVRGVRVLNINDLANAVKPAFLPGERMSVFVVKEGKEAGQGVGYLDDGTMVVVDGASAHRGSSVDLVVTSVLQTSAGKMIFGRRAESSGRSAPELAEPVVIANP